VPVAAVDDVLVDALGDPDTAAFARMKPGSAEVAAPVVPVVAVLLGIAGARCTHPVTVI
jgi:hypothetical protein